MNWKEIDTSLIIRFMLVPDSRGNDVRWGVHVYPYSKTDWRVDVSTVGLSNFLPGKKTYKTKEAAKKAAEKFIREKINEWMEAVND
jgi:hypothetical protein